MLDAKDIEILEKMFQKSEENILKEVDKRFTHSENLILNELDTVQIHLEDEIEKVKKNLNELQQYYRITKLESDNTSILLKMIDDLNKRVQELESKIA